MENKKMETKISSSTPEGREGFEISWSSEQTFGNELLKVLPEGWKVHFDWMQVLFSDVQYQIDKEKKLVEVQYNKELLYWKGKVINEIRYKVEELLK
jgi:hypothetical protein